MLRKGSQVTILDFEAANIDGVEAAVPKFTKYDISTYMPQVPYQYRILENAVRLDDIDKCWYTEEENITVSANLNSHKKYNNFEFGDPSSSPVTAESVKPSPPPRPQGPDGIKIDSLFMKSIVQIITSYAAQLFEIDPKTWEVYNSLNFFQKIAILGFNIFVHDNEMFCRSYDFEKLHRMTGISADAFFGNINDLAVNFATNFDLLDPIITACDFNFENGPRRRMSYTKMFSNPQ